MPRDALHWSLHHVGLALRDPEEFAARWHRNEERYFASVWVALGATAAIGAWCYGMTMGMGHGAAAVLQKAALLTLAAGLAWAIPLPALYVLNSLLGSRLRSTTTLLAALVTTSWGGLAMLASVPISWFFSVAVPELPVVSSAAASRLVFAVHAIVFLGVGVSMADVFGRVMSRLEPESGRWPSWYLALVALIGLQLFFLFGLVSV